MNLNAAFSWAEIAIDQLRVQTAPGAKDEALTAGFVGSGDVTRPGFGWFFGRDALWSLYAVYSYGDFETARQEIEFLLRHQRADGKIMHERSQTAGLVPWETLPYEFAAADSTPLLLMAVNDYLKVSGDTQFVASIWPGLERAWNFETTHDTDGDGIYDNAQGTAWVESWVPKMPHQEIYLAALDEQASLAFAGLARATGHSDPAGWGAGAGGAHREDDRERVLPPRRAEVRLRLEWQRRCGPDGEHFSGGGVVGRDIWSGARRPDDGGLGGQPHFDRLGHAHHQRPDEFLRSDQLSPGNGVAAVHGMGIGGRVSRRARLWPAMRT